MKERFGFTSGDLHSMDRCSLFAIDEAYNETEPGWCFQYRQTNGIHYGNDV